MSHQLLHNPRCSKSRQAKALLEEAGVAFELVEYLKQPLTKNELRQLCDKLGLAPLQMVRKGEDAFTQHGLGQADVTDEQVLEAIATDPILLERPVFVTADRAVIGRPPEKVKELL